MKTMRLVITVAAPNQAPREEVAAALNLVLTSGQELLRDKVIGIGEPDLDGLPYIALEADSQNRKLNLIRILEIGKAE